MGKAVYRMRGDETIVCRRPLRTDQDPSEAQLEARKRFRKAIEHGKDAMYDPDLRALHEEKARESGKPIFCLTIRDFFSPPEITEVDVTAYKGSRGDVISILATDDVRVAGVQVVVTEADGNLLEEGAAKPTRPGKRVYSATQSVPTGDEQRLQRTPLDRLATQAIRD